jgi:acetylornithine deacetylase/succinyl-diaminopimelate desuccinylase-like protein
MSLRDEQLTRALREAIRPEEVVALTVDLIRIPSHRYEESEAASYVAGFMRGLGLDVVVQRVDEGEVHSKQAIGVLRGRGHGRSLMLCGHLDTSSVPPTRQPYRPDLWTHNPFAGDLRDGWIYGLGAMNMKGGVAAILAAAQALIRSGIRPAGDVTVAAVMAETAGGLGVEHLLRSGMRADQAVVTEATDLDVVTIEVSAVRGEIHVEGESDDIQPHRGAVQVAADLVRTFGLPLAPISPGGWLPHTPHPELPGYPRFAIREIGSYGRDFCRLAFECRTVPGIEPDDVRRGLERLLAELGIKGRVETPPHPQTRNRPTARAVERDHPVVQTIARWQAAESGRPASIGPGSRLGGGSDAANLMAAGIPTVVYGPGNLNPTPAVDERVRAADVVTTARVLALAALELTAG